MMAIGAPLAIVSIVFDASATHNLKEAVKTYNGGEGGKLGLALKWRYADTSGRGCLLLGMSYKF